MGPCSKCKRWGSECTCQPQYLSPPAAQGQERGYTPQDGFWHTSMEQPSAVPPPVGATNLASSGEGATLPPAPDVRERLRLCDWLMERAKSLADLGHGDDAALMRAAALALQAPAVSPAPPCPGCGKTESSDGDWYRLCGECRWERLGVVSPAPHAREALETLHDYVQHKTDCALTRGRRYAGVWLCEGESCTCGLDKARAALQPTPDEQE